MRDSDFAVAVALYCLGAAVVVWAAYPRHDVRTRDADGMLSCADSVRTDADAVTHKAIERDFPIFCAVSLRPADASRPASSSRRSP